MGIRVAYSFSSVIGVLSLFLFFFWNKGKTQNICVRVNSVVHFPWHRLRKQAVLFHVDWCRWDAVEPLRDRAKTGSVVLLVRFPELQRFMSWLLIYWTSSSVCHNGTQPEIYFWQETAQPFILCGRPSLGHESSQLTSPTLTRQLEKAGSVSSAGPTSSPPWTVTASDRLYQQRFLAPFVKGSCSLQQG